MSEDKALISKLLQIIRDQPGVIEVRIVEQVDGRNEKTIRAYLRKLAEKEIQRIKTRAHVCYFPLDYKSNVDLEAALYCQIRDLRKLIDRTEENIPKYSYPMNKELAHLFPYLTETISKRITSLDSSKSKKRRIGRLKEEYRKVSELISSRLAELDKDRKIFNDVADNIEKELGRLGKFLSDKPEYLSPGDNYMYEFIGWAEDISGRIREIESDHARSQVSREESIKDRCNKARDMLASVGLFASNKIMLNKYYTNLDSAIGKICDTLIFLDKLSIGHYRQKSQTSDKKMLDIIPQKEDIITCESEELSGDLEEIKALANQIKTNPQPSLKRDVESFSMEMHKKYLGEKSYIFTGIFEILFTTYAPDISDSLYYTQKLWDIVHKIYKEKFKINSDDRPLIRRLKWAKNEEDLLYVRTERERLVEQSVALNKDLYEIKKHLFKNLQLRSLVERMSEKYSERK